MLNGYYLQNAEFVDEKCATYTFDYPLRGCARYKDCKSLGRVKSSYYLDGQLDKMVPSQHDIMKEIIRKGPVITSINTHDIKAFYYSSKAHIGDLSETLESIKDEDSTTVSFSDYEGGIL